MKIRIKLTIFAVILIALAIAASCFFVLTFSKQNTMDRIYAAGVADYERLYNSLSNADMSYSEAAEQTKESYVDYYFKNLYGTGEFVLEKDGWIVSNNTGVDAGKALSSGAQAILSGEYGLELKYKYASIGSTTCFILGGSTHILGKTYDLALVRDVTDIFADISSLAAKCIGISIAIVAVAAFIMAYLIYRSLKPMGELQKGAVALQGGDYKDRIAIKGNNEITELADSFNSMANAIEQHIQHIEATSEERKLLLSALSHEMKTPVTAINACSYSMTHTKMDGEQIKEVAGFIDGECQRLERLSGKLAELISMQGDGLMLTDISADDLLMEVRSILLPIAGKNGIALCLDSHGETLLAEKDLLVCLITNLFDNARKAGATSVCIRINEKTLSITDNGKGIPPEQIDKITQPFYVLDKSRSAEGFGLGLALVKRIAELHHAELTIDSEIGNGTTVGLRL